MAQALANIRALPGHAFWADGISLMDADRVKVSLLSNHARVTDSYLLALARSNGGQLASLDQKLATEAVAEGKAVLALI